MSTMESCSSSRTATRRGHFLCLTGLALLLVAVLQISLHYGACPQDDAFISFRYAQNLVSGHGLVYNPEEWVEGYSNLSWTLLIAGVMAFGGEPVWFSAVLGVAAVCLTLILITLWLPGRRKGRLTPSLLIAPALLASDAEMILEGVEGLETTFYMLLITAAVLRGLHEYRDGREHWASTGLFGLAVLTRPEAPLIFGFFHIGAWLWSENRKDQIRRSARACCTMIALLGLLTTWRLTVYGVPLPNTFYAKTGGFALPRGLAYLGDHMTGHLLLWGFVAVRMALGKLTPAERVIALLCGAQLAYVAWIGGDFKPTGRFVIPVLPLLCLLAQQGMVESWARMSRLPQPFGSPLFVRRVLAIAGTILVVGVGKYDFQRAFETSTEWAHERTANLQSRREVGTFLRENFPPDTVLAIHSAGAIPYYAQLPTIDMWGLSNAHIARTSPEGMGTGLAGHEKTDPEYVFSLEPHLYLPEDKVFTFKSWELEPGPGFPEDFRGRYVSRSIAFAGDPVRHLNLWIRRGLLRCLNSRVLFSDGTTVSGRYQADSCNAAELQTWADLDLDSYPVADPSCCFAIPSSALDAKPVQLDLRGFVPDESQPWDCDDDNELQYPNGPGGCPELFRR
jgi:arabinofuranosyltransferase